MMLGTLLAVSLTSKNGFRPFLNLVLIVFSVCAVGFVAAIVQTKAGKRFLGMDRGLWIAGSCLACVAGGVIGYVAKP
jgi:hypothetical protein